MSEPERKRQCLGLDDTNAIYDFISKQWDETVVPTLSEYIKVPCQSPSYDAEWSTNGLLEKAFDILIDWVKVQNVPGLTMKYKELTQSPKRTPFLFIEIAGTDNTEKTLLMYGHMDKQPPLLPWGEGLDPYVPVIRDGKLYGRAGADDGYSICSAVGSIQALKAQGIPHARIVIVIEACEESGSGDLPGYIDEFRGDIGKPDLIICLDSGALNYDQMWLTTSLRGVMSVRLDVSLMTGGVHSGLGSGIVPSSFRVLRQLLTRLEDENTGEVKIKELHCDIPQEVIDALPQVDALGLGPFVEDKPLHPSVKLAGKPSEFAIANWWKPTVSYTGVGGIPPLEKAGNVLREKTSMILSIRLPPLTDGDKAFAAVKQTLETDTPYGAVVTVTNESCGLGWCAPAIAPWLATACDSASQTHFGKTYGLMGAGGSIPFMGMLHRLFPEAQFVITGVLGPKSNAHGPDEFLHIDFGKRITSCVANIVESHYNQFCKK